MLRSLLPFVFAPALACGSTPSASPQVGGAGADASGSGSTVDGSAAGGGDDAGDTSSGGQDAGWDDVVVADAAIPPPTTCGGSYAAPTETAVSEPALLEASGIARSLRNPDVLWSHNDSGDTARIFAIGTNGSPLGQLSLSGVVAHDFEDIETALCPDGSGPCVWIADTGNNAHNRTNLAVYAVPEPAVSPGAPLGSAVASQFWTFPVHYPQGVAIDSEALVVQPDGSAFYLFEKIDAATARIFGATGPFTTGVNVPLAQVGAVASPGIAVTRGLMITAADIHPSGDRILLRVYTGVFEYRLHPGDWPGNLAGATRSTVTLGPMSEPQGEAVSYDASGTGLWTISEDPQLHATQPLHHYACN